jgi:hypothetical protein
MRQDRGLRAADGEDGGAREVGGEDRVADRFVGRALVLLRGGAQAGPPTKALKVMSV